MATWLVTGGTGFLGRHALAALRSRAGDEVWALGRRCPPGWQASRFVAADLDWPEALAAAVREVRPGFVVHAAGRTPPGDSDSFDRANRQGAVNLLDALFKAGRPCRVVLAGSAAELGPVPVEALPVGEDYPCRPADDYGLSKWRATRAGLSAPRPLEVMVARVFNPIGPGQPVGQAFGRFAARLLDPTPGVLHAGGLDVRRDFVDVRDVARAFLALAERGAAGRVYHVGRGVSQRVGDGLDRLLRRSGRDLPVRVDLSTPSGPADSRAAVGRIFAETGWRAVLPFGRSLDDLWDEAAGASRLPLTG